MASKKKRTSEPALDPRAAAARKKYFAKYSGDVRPPERVIVPAIVEAAVSRAEEMRSALERAVVAIEADPTAPSALTAAQGINALWVLFRRYKKVDRPAVEHLLFCVHTAHGLLSGGTDLDAAASNGLALFRTTYPEFAESISTRPVNHHGPGPKQEPRSLQLWRQAILAWPPKRGAPRPDRPSPYPAIAELAESAGLERIDPETLSKYWSDVRKRLKT